MKKLKLIIYNFLIIILTTKCGFFQAPVKNSIVEGKLFKKYTNEPLVGCQISANVQHGFSVPEDLGKTVTDKDGKFSLKVLTEYSSYSMFFDSYNEPEFYIEFPSQTGSYREMILSNSQNYNLSLPIIFPMGFIPDFHNTKPFDKNDKLIAEYYQNGKLIKNPQKTKEGREEYLGDSLDFKRRNNSWFTEGNTYLKIKMFITKNGKTELREDSVFCMPLKTPTPATKRIEY
jgi:hypothetical protein